MKSLLVIILGLFSFAAQANSEKTIHVPASKKVFEITLSANPSTGFQWSLDNFDHSLLKLQSQRYEAPQTKLVGAPGTSIFTFERLDEKLSTKRTKVTLQYGRTWEPSSAMSTTITIVFDKNL